MLGLEEGQGPTEEEPAPGRRVPPLTHARTADLFSLVGGSSVLFWSRKAEDPQGSRE